MATSVAITASAKETALPSSIPKALDQSLPCTEVTLLLNRDQPPAKPGDNSQDDHNSDKRDHHESKAKTAGPELLIVSQVVTHAGRDARPIIDRAVRDALHAGLNGVPLALSFRVQGLLRSLPAFYVSNR